jgi:peptidoglycan DL-endopeptidase LytE
VRKTFVLSTIVVSMLLFGYGSGFSEVYKVKNGDTLQKIAKKYRVSIDSLKEWNGLNSSALHLGQKLSVKDATVRPSKPSKKGKRTVPEPEPVVIEENDEVVAYHVQKGDTLERIASRFNVDKQDIIDLNEIKKRKKLAPGTTLYLPKTDDDASDEMIVLQDSQFARRPVKHWKNEEERVVLVKVAKSFAGAPYKFGGESVRGLDCSAFVKKMYDIFDVQLPRSAREQFCTGMPVSKEELTTGDLVFFKSKRAKHPTHVGIYIGEDKFIHASSLLRRGVKIDCLSDSYFTRTYTGAVRVKAMPTERSESTQDSAKTASNS